MEDQQFLRGNYCAPSAFWRCNIDAGYRMQLVKLLRVIVTSSCLVIFVTGSVSQRVPFVPPFFFLCSYDGVDDQSDTNDNQVALSVSVEGDPDFYVPGQRYTVTVSSSHSFDGFLLTGLYTLVASTSPVTSSISASGARSSTLSGRSATTGGSEDGAGGPGQRALRNVVAALGGRSAGERTGAPSVSGGSASGFVCSIVHSHIGRSPRQQLSFVWLAPPSGTGCINFLATASLGSQVLFKDTTVLQLCEYGHSSATPRLSALHQHGLIFRDDFESIKGIDRKLWRNHSGIEVSKRCHMSGYGSSAVACNTSSDRQLVTVPLNLSAASVLQFSVGSCLNSQNTGELIGLQYGIAELSVTSTSRRQTYATTTVATTESVTSRRTTRRFKPWDEFGPFLDQPADEQETSNGAFVTTQPSDNEQLVDCTHWTDIDQFRLPRSADNVDVHLVHLPRAARRDNVCLRWNGVPVDAQSQGQSTGCWAIDNVVITNTAHHPSFIQESFDPIDVSNWLFFPGAKIQHGCESSDGNSAVFNDDPNVESYLMTRDLNLYSDVKPLYEQTFDSGALDRWLIEGGELSQRCGELHHKQSAVFSGQAKTRQLCTPYLDMTQVGSVSFYFSFGSRKCSKSNSAAFEKSKVLVYAEDLQRDSVLLVSLTRKSYTEQAKLVNVPVRTLAQRNESRICWLQKTHGGEDWDVWAVDAIKIAGARPRKTEFYAQFDLKLNCNQDPTEQVNNSIVLEFSTNHGENWFPLYEPCYPGLCQGPVDTTSTVYDDSEYFQTWRRVTVILPNKALSPSVRFRWRQIDNEISRWAIDNVYIGACPNGCGGRGRCTPSVCQCDTGFDSTPSCEKADDVTLLPSTLVAPISSVNDLITSFSSFHGISVGYHCGVLANGKAAVFNQPGQRLVETVDINMVSARFVQFSIRVGGRSNVGDCPSPNLIEESVLLQYTCNNGIEWHHLQTMTAKQFNEPALMVVKLPADAQGSSCRLRWWQPMHSGLGRDVWAIDDISITGKVFNTIWFNFTDSETLAQALDVNNGKLGPHCGRQKTLVFSNVYQASDVRYLVTNAMQVGPSFIIQFELVMNCQQVGSPQHLDAPIHLEYSTDHGITWNLVRAGCWPPRTCAEYHLPTVYHRSEFPEWKRVTVKLPPTTWSSETKFRLRQDLWTGSNSWAIGNLYIGQQCPELCNGHGLCDNGLLCRCDENFGGETCRTPLIPLAKSMKSDFSLVSETSSDWLEIIGGEVAATEHGCGTILSGESLFFYKDGIRRAVTSDIDMTDADFIQFYVQLGGAADSRRCRGAKKREESVLIMYSIDGGVTWNFIEEVTGMDYTTARFVHLALPEAAQTPTTRIMFWQPQNSGHNVDQWALDGVIINGYKHMKVLEDNFDSKPLSDEPGGPRLGSHTEPWLIVTDSMLTPYCSSSDNSLMLLPQNNDKVVITRDMNVKPDDVIQFKINVGCSQSFSYRSPVHLQYSHDSGVSWTLVREPCYLPDKCGHYSEGSVYHSGLYGEWRTVVIPLNQHIASKRTNFRWWQQGDASASFGLDDVYIGPPCPDWCHGHGRCVAGRCSCELGYTGDSCWQSDQPSPSGLIERFEDVNKPSALWENVYGGSLGSGCGNVGAGNALYFNDLGAREARTVALDTKQIKPSNFGTTESSAPYIWQQVLQFRVRIGDKSDSPMCKRPQYRQEAVVVDYTTNNGVVWNTLKQLDPFVLSDAPQTVTISLPESAKTNSTSFRWWQPFNATDSEQRAQWALDDIVIAVNDSSRNGFEENFSPLKSDVWYTTINAIPKVTCRSQNNALEFSKNGDKRYAETWDYKVTPSTFLQFDIAMGCSGTLSTRYYIQVQYSVDLGRSWFPVAEPCGPRTRHDCSGYNLSNNFVSEAYANWTRVTLYLPPGAVSSSTRFRWLQQTVALRGNIWALDNIYLGDGCPWMCSGHGYCRNGKCRCDDGYFGEFCVPLTPLPMFFRDDFETVLQHELWPEVYGGDVTDICDTVVSGSALTFYKDTIRMAVTQDLDVTMSLYIQFSFKYGCQQHSSTEWRPGHSVLLQFSSNGGIMWHFLHEIHFVDTSLPKYFTLRIPLPALTNATRFRFWQPQHEGRMKSVWSLDNVFVGGSVVNPDMIFETFDVDPNPDEWPFYPGGRIAEFCSLNAMSGVLLPGVVAMTFNDVITGERSITSREVSVNDLSVIQFDINVGCTDETSDIAPVRLEYSLNGGRTWQTVLEPCSSVGRSVLDCAELDIPATVYYPGTSLYWRRIVVPLNGLQICGVARFRWTQGRVAPSKSADDGNVAPPSGWAVDNVYIGMQCEDHCSGHGVCMNGMFCQCDDGYTGTTCNAAAVDQLPQHIKDDFEADNNNRHGNSIKWLIKSGADRTSKCGTVLSGKSMHFHGKGERILQSNDIDLRHATVIQFYLKFGCGSSQTPTIQPEPVLLQFSTDGGIHFITIEQFEFPTLPGAEVIYIAREVPLKMKSSSARIQWIQPSLNGSFSADWAIDQVYVGGDDKGLVAVQDSLTSTDTDNWLMYPGARIQSTCGLNAKSLHFAGVDSDRYAVTKDLTVTENTYLQFSISMGCSHSGRCYSVEVQYSLDWGQTWSLVFDECLLTKNVDCAIYRAPSILTSDTYYSWTRVTYKLPLHTRSKATRFRWIQLGRHVDSESTWAITAVYIGDECDCSCAGHGRCDRGRCICDKGWTGTTCSEPVWPLHTQLIETFTTLPDDVSWTAINGGTISRQCGVLATGTAMHMKGDCTRQMITTDFDLRLAKFVQFYFRFGCSSPSRKPVVVSGQSASVLIEFSSSGGTVWYNLAELHSDQYRITSFVTIDLPKQAKKNGVRLRFWQPRHVSQSIHSDWIIDDIVIGGKEVNPNEVNDDFGSNQQTIHWLQTFNARHSSYCGAADALVASPSAAEGVMVTTSDLAVNVGDVMEFSLLVGGCNASRDVDVLAPVKLHYSNDYGVTWHLVVDECLPFDSKCGSSANTASIFYPTSGWKRVTLLLHEPLASLATRFRWSQEPSEVEIESLKKLVPVTWALDDLYIGRPCPAMCNGHGRCDYPRCVCDTGYNGPTCDNISDDLVQMSMFDTFNDGLNRNSGQWLMIQGGRVGIGCTPDVDGRGLVFDGLGRRQAVTRDLDLRNAKHVQYNAMIGGQSGKVQCSRPQSRDDDVIVQYSVDGGVTWQLLHVMDHAKYWSGLRHDYIVLPIDARTSNTRIRWWQRLPWSRDWSSQQQQHKDNDTKESAAWFLDDVNVGGMEISPSSLFESFNNGLNRDKWEFHPSGKIEDGVCGADSMVMSWTDRWSNKTEKSITTCQLIVQEDYILQFKIVVGCRQETHLCDRQYPVVLEYNRDPSDERWYLVHSECLPDERRASGVDCRPYMYRPASVYTAAEFGKWTRVTLNLPSTVFSSQTRFRWRQIEQEQVFGATVTPSQQGDVDDSRIVESSPLWAVDDVYIGERCHKMCYGRGSCVHGACICDIGYTGGSCDQVTTRLLSSMTEGFEGGVIMSSYWSSVEGGSIGLGCGALSPAAHGKNLYFNGCGLRHAITAEMDLSKASKVMFALQIGSWKQSALCNVKADADNSHGSVLLQFTNNKGVDWTLIAVHKPQDYLTARKVVYELPHDARTVGAQLRWSQPLHRGSGHDQWAIDHIEVAMTHQDQMLREINGGYAGGSGRRTAPANVPRGY